MTATNSLGYQVERFSTINGWVGCSPIFPTMSEAQTELKKYRFLDGQYRAYEALAPAVKK